MTDIPVVTTWHRLNNTFHFLTKGSGSPFNIFCCKNTGYNGSSCCTASLQFFNIIQADTANGYYRDLYRCADCPEPADEPGYTDKVVMASGSFTEGSTIEISCDGPLRTPYTCYLQGGVNFTAGRAAVLNAVQNAFFAD